MLSFEDDIDVSDEDYVEDQQKTIKTENLKDISEQNFEENKIMFKNKEQYKERNKKRLGFVNDLGRIITKLKN